MNEPPDPLTDDDLSAFLDGEADAAVTARVAADHDAQARLAHLTAAADALAGTPVDPLDQSVIDGLVATALAAADESDAAATIAADAGGRPPAPPAPRRRGAPQWLVAAGLVVLVGIGMALVWSGTRSDRSTTTDVAATATESSETPSSKSAGDVAADGADGAAGSEASDGTAGAGGHGSPTTVAPAAGTVTTAPVVELGSFATADALRTALAVAFPTEDRRSSAGDDGPARSVSSAAVERCSGLIQQVLPVAGGPTHTGVAEVAGKTVVVYEFAAADEPADGTPTTGPKATTLTVAVHPDACDQVLAFQR